MVRAWRLVDVLATHTRVRRCFTQSHLAAAQTMRRIVAAAALGCMIASTDAFGGGCLVPLRRGPAAATAGLRMQAGAQEDPAAVMARVNQMMAGKPSAAASAAAPVAPADVAPIQADPVDAVLARTASMMSTTATLKRDGSLETVRAGLDVAQAAAIAAVNAGLGPGEAAAAAEAAGTAVAATIARPDRRALTPKEVDCLKQTEVDAAIAKLKADAIRAEQAAIAAREKALAPQVAMGTIKRSFSDKLAAVAEKAFSKLKSGTETVVRGTKTLFRPKP